MSSYAIPSYEWLFDEHNEIWIKHCDQRIVQKHTFFFFFLMRQNQAESFPRTDDVLCTWKQSYSIKPHFLLRSLLAAQLRGCGGMWGMVSGMKASTPCPAKRAAMWSVQSPAKTLQLHPCPLRPAKRCIISPGLHKHEKWLPQGFFFLGGHFSFIKGP